MDDLFEHFDAITSSGYTVSVFTRWGENVDQVWIKTRADSAGLASVPDDGLFGAVPSTQHRHPILGLDPVNCTPSARSRRARGPTACPISGWASRRAPARSSNPSTIVHRSDAAAAIEAVRGVAAAIRPLIRVSEIRTIAADALWMSPQYGRDTVAIHFTWSPEPTAVRRALAEVERVLARLRHVPLGQAVPRRRRRDRPAVRTARGISSPCWIASTRGRRSATTGFDAHVLGRLPEQLAPAELGRVPERRPRLVDVEQRVVPSTPSATGTPGKTSAISSRLGRFITVSAAAMMKLSAPSTSASSASRTLCATWLSST